MKSPEQLPHPSESRFKLFLYFVRAGLHKIPDLAVDLIREYLDPDDEVTDAREGMYTIKEQLRLNPKNRSEEKIAVALTAISHSLVTTNISFAILKYWEMFHHDKSLLVGEAFLFDKIVMCLYQFDENTPATSCEWKVPGTQQAILLYFSFKDNTLLVIDKSTHSPQLESKSKQDLLHRIGIRCSEQCEQEHSQFLWK